MAALADPVQDIDVLVSKPGFDGLGGVAGGTILHEDAAPCDVQAGLEVFLEDPLVHFCVHLGILLHKVEAAQLAIAEGGPDHELGRMLHSAADEPGIVARHCVGSADAATLLHALPELYVSFVTPHNLPPPVLRPGLVALGPVEAAEHLRLGKEGLGRGESGGDAELLGDDTADCLFVDFTQGRDGLLETLRREEGVLVKLLLDLGLEGIANLPQVEASKILLAGSGAGDNIVVVSSGDHVPGAGFLGGSPPVPQSTGGDLEHGRDFSWSVDFALQH